MMSVGASARSVGSVCRLLRDAMSRSGADAHIDDAVLVLSEIVTNALVHTASAVTVHYRVLTKISPARPK